MLLFFALLFLSGTYSGWYVRKNFGEIGRRRDNFWLELTSYFQASGILCEKGKKKYISEK